MRLRLSLVFLLIALAGVSLLAQTVANAGDQPVFVPAHPLPLLQWRLNRSVPFGTHTFLSPNGGVVVEYPWTRVPRQPMRPFNVDPKMNLFAQSGGSVDANTCFKLRKYIFHPREETPTAGAAPLRGPWQQVGETDCTYANKVWPKAADGKPRRPNVGLQSAVVRSK